MCNIFIIFREVLKYYFEVKLQQLYIILNVFPYNTNFHVGLNFKHIGH